MIRVHELSESGNFFVLLIVRAQPDDDLPRGGDVLGGLGRRRLVGQHTCRRRRPAPASLARKPPLLGHHLPLAGNYREWRRPLPVAHDGHTTGQWHVGS